MPRRSLLQQRAVGGRRSAKLRVYATKPGPSLQRRALVRRAVGHYAEVSRGSDVPRRYRSLRQLRLSELRDLGRLGTTSRFAARA